ncbi:hypothetical protein Pint_17278 [Pistacia integerrima]|uniref:Uncharacterized protein n=1 Tax=Pistacia integerrima TaxID=434235 RepID=A0ACC0YUH3_9ROSI|nr:hypothetical protein Pint_17278 [Pistacia integerrima]
MEPENKESTKDFGSAQTTVRVRDCYSLKMANRIFYNFLTSDNPRPTKQQAHHPYQHQQPSPPPPPPTSATSLFNASTVPESSTSLELWAATKMPTSVSELHVET